MTVYTKIFSVLLILFLSDQCLYAQDLDSLPSGKFMNPFTLPASDADSSYILKYARANDIRVLYGGEGTSLAYGSKRNGGQKINADVYNNVNDLIGFGITYKILDADISYSLPKTRLMEEDRENLEQFRLSLSYTGRHYALRGFLIDSKGVVSEDVAKQFKSNADVRFFKVGAQVTYYFNAQKYSYRAANFQSELQRKTAGSFLLRLEPSYKQLEAKSGLVPESRDLVSVYGEQAGLQHVNAPGLLVMPGYGVNVVVAKGKFFFSPYVMGGPGFAVNTYKSDQGNLSAVNMEWAAIMALNIGYNGDRAYAAFKVAGDLYYTPLNPAYFTTTSLKINITVGYRFKNIEKFIPATFL